ncbi:hypothetical protein DVH05_026313 [Phytophthora capsici]|nr:hypothetical protein DVH05_026313 [Phytophthora capsici]
MTGSFEILCDEKLLQDLAAETYVMRLGEGSSALSLMPDETRAVHEAAFEAFHAGGRTASRSVEALCRDIGVEPVSETGPSPYSTSRVYKGYLTESAN